MRVRIDYLPPVTVREDRGVRTVVPEFDLPKGWTLLELKTVLERREFRMVDVDAEKAAEAEAKRAAAAKRTKVPQEAGKP